MLFSSTCLLIVMFYIKKNLRSVMFTCHKKGVASHLEGSLAYLLLE
jgi:hypothetical protein